MGREIRSRAQRWVLKLPGLCRRGERGRSWGVEEVGEGQAAVTAGVLTCDTRSVTVCGGRRREASNNS